MAVDIPGSALDNRSYWYSDVYGFWMAAPIRPNPGVPGAERVGYGAEQECSLVEAPDGEGEGMLATGC